jgi:hypothetical protein
VDSSHKFWLALAALAAAAALLPASTAAGRAAGPGVLEPGRSLAGLHLGATPAQVRAAWGGRFGRCRSCTRPTWYFNERPFRPQGAGVEFRQGRAAALFTVWAPPGWRTDRGLALGEPVVRVTEVYGALARVECGRYYALTLRTGQAVTAFYVVGEELWGFGLSRPDVPVCR